MPLRTLTELFLVQVAEGSHSSRPHGSLHCPPLYAKVKQAIVGLSPRDSSHSHPWQDSCKNLLQPMATFQKVSVASGRADAVCCTVTPGRV